MLSTYKTEMLYDEINRGTIIIKALNKKQAKTFAINEGIRKYNPNGDSIGIENIYKLYNKKSLLYWKKLKLK